ncbi:adenomatous polyposis coli protein 2 [Cricetulus griseus]|uniref:Adenomatous polyposis coli protein 2 n=1 Tax=Cricetulus griseus TaxID=10029 RepID=A0A061I350_CRIGR|nr:adenomatous polyposis coli protein 2 [Cricetulus griseus]
MGLLGLLSLLHSAFFGDQALQELKMTSSMASYEQLVRQVEALKAENTNLRQELRDNSSHLSKLETETSGMKEVLKHLQGKLEQEARVLVSSGQTEVLEQLKALQTDISSLYNLKFQPPALGPEPAARTPEGSPVHGSGPPKDGFGELSRATIRLLEELDQERCFLLSEIEKEEKEKLWYYSQLQGLSKRLDELPHVDTQFSMQMDLIRQQLEFEAQHIRSLMEERFGTSDEMVQRAQIRASRLEQIDKELLEAQDRVQQTEPQALLAVKPVAVEEDQEPEVPTHPEDGIPHPGNSKVEVVFWLLSMLATRDQEDTARTLLAMSSSPESCVAMRRSGCLPLLLQILHGTEAGAGGRAGTPGAPGAKDARMRANAAMHNIVFSQPDQGLARKEMRVLHVLEQIRAYCETCWDWLQTRDSSPEGGAGGAPVPIEPQICQATCAVMKLSFDEEYRRAMNELGGLQAVAELLQVDYEMHKMTRDPLNLALRRYAGMTLTNLTFGDVANKVPRGGRMIDGAQATLCARRGCMEAIVAQLASESEELHQVVSSILRNLSWRADINSKKVLREVGSMTALMECVLRASKVSMAGVGLRRSEGVTIATGSEWGGTGAGDECLDSEENKESTLKSVLSALWNLSAHSTENKAAICQVDGALGFLVSTLTYRCQGNSLAVIESGGGILRNVSSLIATREDYSLYVRKQKALEAELDTRRLVHALGHLEKQGLPEAETASKKPLPPLRHLDGLVQDYASDSGCFDDDDAPSLAAAATTAEPTSPAVLSMFLGGPFLQGQALARSQPARQGGLEAEKEAGGEAAVAAKAKAKLALAVARIDRLVEDISALHTSSDDSFSLSSGDPGQEAPREGRAQSCSPCRGTEGGRREVSSRAHPLLRLKAAHTSLSNDSLNRGSTSHGYCPREHMRPCPLAALAEHREDPLRGQTRPSRLDLDLPSRAELPARDTATTNTRVRTIKLSPTYQHVPLRDGAAGMGIRPLAGPGASPGTRKQAWIPADSLSKVPEKLVSSPLPAASKVLQKLVAQDGPMSLSRCSSLSSLSSAGHAGPSQAGNLDDSDSSLEGLEEAGPGEAELDGVWRASGSTSLPVSIPAPHQGHSRGLGVEDATPSSSSENCVQETPLVLSRCSSVSSLGSFESRSIASSIPSDPCSGLGSGTVSPSELPDSPGQTMPPSRSKTPPAPAGQPETSQFSLQWESYVKRFLDIADCRERCQPPSELDAGSVRFTVEKPDENFSCASSLSALALHELYVQQDVELRLRPPACPEHAGGGGGHRWRDEAAGRLDGPAPTGSRARSAADKELEVLRECLGAAMPARLRKVVSALVPGRRALPVPVYMLVPAPAQDDDSGTDSAEGTPVNFSSAASLSDETLQGPSRDKPGGPGERQKLTGRAVPARQTHRHRPKTAGAGTEHTRGAGRNRAGLELPLSRPQSARSNRDGWCQTRPRGDGALQSLCLTTPTEEAVYCFYDSDEEPAATAPPPWQVSAIPRALKHEKPTGRKETPSRVSEPVTPPVRAQPRLIVDETPPCYSSASSLSEPEASEQPFSHPGGRELATTKDPGPGSKRDSSPSPRAEEELLQRCNSLALPRYRTQVPGSRRRKPRAARSDVRPTEVPQKCREEVPGSDPASDLDSVEWQAIQEGANSIVTWLHQAAAKASLEASSESDSLLSLVSGLSAGSTLQSSKHRKVRKPGAEAGGNWCPEKRDATSTKISRSRRFPSGPEKAKGTQKVVAGEPAMLRGRTVIYTARPASRAQSKGVSGPCATPKKMGTSGTTQPETATKAPSPGQQRSRSLHRPGKISELAALSHPPRSATPPARLAKTPSSNSSQTSPASQPLPRRSPLATPTAGPLPGPGGSPVPKSPARALLAKQHKTQKSPVRIPFMQRPAKRGPPPLARPSPEPGSRGRAGAEGAPGARGGRLGLVRMASVRSSGSESSDRSGFRRQLTFIKESPRLLRCRRSELSSADSPSSSSQATSPRRGRPALPAVFLCSSRCDELRASPKQPLAPQRSPQAKPGLASLAPRRTSSESPSRLPVRAPPRRPETVKRYASLPHISVACRPDNAVSVPTTQVSTTRRGSDGETRPLPRVAAPGTTWRRIKDEDVPHILRSTLPATALPLRGPSPEDSPAGTPQRKTSDAVVQTEDVAASTTNSSTSPSLESRDLPQAQASGPDVDGAVLAKPTASAPFTHEGLSIVTGGFPTARHGSPSRAARVPPFNYVPSPMVVATAASDSALEKAPVTSPASLLE